MSENQNNQTGDPDRLKYENELRKIKLSLESGAIFSNPPNTNEIPPELESEFLKSIEAFESQYVNAELITVYDYIGRPDYQPADLIIDDKIGEALENILEVLNTNGIALDTLCDIEDRVLYTFITRELFFHEMDNIRIEGMTLHFIYEEFHPNHDYDIRNVSAGFIQTFLDKDSDYYTTFLTERAEEETDLLYFRESFSSFNISHFSICSIRYQDNKGEVVFNTEFTATIEKSTEIVHFNGEGIIELEYQYDFWYINQVKFPAAC